MRSAGIWRAFWLLATLAGACGGSSGGGTDGGGGATTPVANFQQEVAAAFHSAFSCLMGVDPAQAPHYEAILRVKPPLQGSNILDAVAAGRARFDAGKAAACLAALSAHSPPSCFGPSAEWVSLLGPRSPVLYFSTTHGPCAGVFVGTVAPGGSCRLDEECADGWCDARPDACPGTCHALGGAGAGCSRMGTAYSSYPDDDLCGVGLVCGSTGCTPVGPPGPAGAPCRRDEECDSGLSCLGSLGEQSSFHCRAPVAAGGSCFTDSDCVRGLTCKLPGRTCEIGAGEGESCDLGTNVIGWLHSFACQGNQVCVGDTTIVNDRGSLASPGMCRTPQNVGGPCVQVSSSFHAKFLSGCLLGLACDPQTSRCVVAPSAPSPCSSEGACATGAVCRAGACVALQADGTSCGFDTDCLSSYCDKTSASPVCGTPPACQEP